ncbi:MAG TPA: NADP-dependent oxidoreductase [Bryobacteraceae bacterium]|nr:NADP-dependent oxidoreductase [Bryobacteraceae bacterium]
MQNRRIVLASRPEGEPTPDNFRLETVETAPLKEGEVLLRTLYLSLDPYMRGRMSDAPSYAEPVKIGEVMVGSTVSEVMESTVAGLQKGDTVTGFSGWQEYAVVPARGLRKLNPENGPVSLALGVLGMPGLTAYTGLLNIGNPKPGETVVVSAASGAVGAVVGQIAKIKGCRVVGVAGGEAKCQYVVEELGFDACVDHRSATLHDDLKAACPKGVDVYFENVGGKVLEAVLPRMNDFSRMPVCGLISQYNLTDLSPGPDRTAVLMRAVLTKRIRMQGFIVLDYASQMPDFLHDVATWLRDGKMKYKEDIVDGLDKAPEALIGVLNGRNFGKMLVRF